MPSDMTPEQAAEAMMDASEISFRLQLTRLVDGEHTYTVECDGEVRYFSETGDAYEWHREKRAAALTQALRTYGDQRAAEAREQALREAVEAIRRITPYAIDPTDEEVSYVEGIDEAHGVILDLLNVRPEVKPSGPFSMVSNVR